jgi:outer membrane protein assembly factor BamA
MRRPLHTLGTSVAALALMLSVGAGAAQAVVEDPAAPAGVAAPEVGAPPVSGAAARGVTATAGQAAPAETDTAGVDEGGFLETLGTAADWFLARSASGDQHDRTWGVVPLVVASSTDGFGGGVKFVETDLFGVGMRIDTELKATSNEFYVAEATLGGPPVPVGPGVKWGLTGGYSSRPRLPFYGIGNGAEEDDQAALWLEETYSELRLGHTFFSDSLALFGVFRFENVNARDGRENDPLDLEPISQKYDTALLTGYADDGFTNAVGLSVLLDNRDNDFDPKEGWRVEVGALYHGPEIGDSPFRFGSYHADVAFYQPLVGRNLVLAVRGRIDLVDAGLESVPFYALPSLGGGDSLRGYLDGRWRDRHAVLFQGEVRFPIWRVLAGAAFVDAGRVFRDVTDPPFLDDFHFDAGVGLRLILHPDILSRFDVAASKELVTFSLSWGQTF